MERLRKLNRLSALALSASLALSQGGIVAAQETPNVSLQNGGIIDAANFSHYFAKCDSRKQLVQAGIDEEKPIFPIAIDDPKDITIFVLPSKDQAPSAAIIETQEPVNLLSTVDGKMIPPIEADLTSENFITGIDDNSGTIYMDSVDQASHIQVEFALRADALIRLFKSGRDNIDTGEPFMQFISSGPLFKGAGENSFGIAIVDESQIPSSDLSRFATNSEGRIIYCDSQQVTPIRFRVDDPNQDPTKNAA